MAEYYKIRLSWNGGKWDKTQKGAYLYKDQAIAQCTQELIDQGYKVFSPTGEIVYPAQYHELAEQMYKDGITTDVDYWSKVFNGVEAPKLDFVEGIIRKYSNKLKDALSYVPEVKTEKILYNDVEMFKVPASLFKVKWFDKAKKYGDTENYCNAGYFGYYDDGDVRFTLPSGNIVADINESSVNPVILKYLYERKIENNKLYFSACKNTDRSFRNSNVSTLVIDNNNKASIIKVNDVENGGYKYAVSGAPVIYDYKCYSNYMDEGWDSSIARATYHIFLGLVGNSSDFVYVFVYKTKNANLFTSKEVYNKFKDFGFSHLIKLDGGGSTHIQFQNKVVISTSENRHINTIIEF